MTQRPDALLISLGSNKPRRTAALKRLALAMNMSGRKGDGSISELITWIADTAEIAPDEMAKLLNAAGWIAAGGEWDEMDFIL